MMTENRSFNLFSYNSWFLVISMVGFGVLGTGILWIFQCIFDIPPWTQYILLTLWLAADFIFFSFAAAKPTHIEITDQDISLESNLQTIKIPWTDILSYRISDELLLISIKIKLVNEETISIIDFKWHETDEVYAFLQTLHPYLKEDDVEDIPETDKKINSFLKKNSKTILGILFFMVYVNITLNLDEQGVIISWNPILQYFYWIIPILTFFKLVFTK